MGTKVIGVNFDVLQEELDKAKSNLKGLNDNIRRISGRDPSEQLSRNERKRPLEHRLERDRDFDHRNRRSGQLDGSPPPKRKAEAKSVFSRLSGPPSSKDDEKPKLNSRIIRELPTKEEIVEAQGSDPASRARNRRMFGSLMGTLQKFCQEESRLRNKEEKKAKIERKLEEQQNQEREIMKKERQNLYNNRKRQQLEIKMLEHKMNVMKEFTTFEEAKKPLMNFIRTKNKPYIYYLPKVLDKQTESKLADSKRDIQKQIDRRQEEVKKELNEIVSRFENSFEALHSIDVHSDDETNHNLSLKSAVNASTANNNENDDKRSHRDDEDDVDEDHIIHEAKTDNHKNDKSKENKKANVNKVSVKVENDDHKSAKEEASSQSSDDDKRSHRSKS